MGAAESKAGDGLEDVQAQLNAIRAQESLLLHKMQVRRLSTKEHASPRAPAPSTADSLQGPS
jgi:hypothetical protein